MSQKSSVPQAVSFVSRALKRDIDHLTKGLPTFWHVADAIAVPDTLSCHPETHW
jgi:hypothetical protein